MLSDVSQARKQQQLVKTSEWLPQSLIWQLFNPWGCHF